MGILSDLKSIFNASKTYVEPQPKTHVQSNDSPNEKKHNHRVAGTSHYEENILKLAAKNNYYDLSKKEIIARQLYDKCIPQYTFLTCNRIIELIPEPTNEYDPYAIQVKIDSFLVGYIKAGSCKRIFKLIESGKIERIDCAINGGNYKMYWHDGIDLHAEKGKSNYSIQITIYEK